MVSKAEGGDFAGRFREVVSDPLNLLIERVPLAGVVENNEVCLHNGIRVPASGNAAYYGSFSMLLIINRGVHEPLEEYVFQELLRRLPEAPRMIELGAYWGHYSMWLKKMRPQATTILVEPDANNLAVGRHNFQRNGFEGEFIQAFVAAGQFEVDPFLESRGIGHLDVLHVDIQGHEVEMLAGVRRALAAHRIDYLLISTHSQDIHKAVLGGLAEAGYRVEAACDFDNETTSYDGFVFAVSPQVAPLFDSLAPLGRVRIAESGPDALIDSLIAVKRAVRAG
jgi:hypothetical protein